MAYVDYLSSFYRFFHLWTYAKVYRPNDLLYTVQTGSEYSGRSLPTVFRTAIARARIIKPVIVPALRHAYATRLLEIGLNLRYIQAVLGHSSPKTTQVYAHVSLEYLKKEISMLEKLNLI